MVLTAPAWPLSPPPTYPVEIFEVELLEDGITAFQLVPSHSPQVGQQLVPLLSTQPVGFASLEEEKHPGPRAFPSMGQNRAPDLWGIQVAWAAVTVTDDLSKGSGALSNRQEL